MGNASDQLLTAREIAEIFRVHHTTVVRWAKDDVIPSVRIGSVVRFRRADVERLLNPGPEPEKAA